MPPRRLCWKSLGPGTTNVPRFGRLAVRQSRLHDYAQGTLVTYVTSKFPGTGIQFLERGGSNTVAAEAIVKHRVRTGTGGTVIRKPAHCSHWNERERHCI